MNASAEVAWHGQRWDPVLIEATALGLRPARPAAVSSPEQAAEVLRQAGLDHLEGLLVEAVAEAAVIWPDDAIDTLIDQHESALVTSVIVESQLLRVAALMEPDKIQWRLIKGAAAAHLDYADPGLRQFGDVDMLVHPESWVPFCEVLLNAGWTRPRAERRPGFDLAFGKGATFVEVGPPELEVDAHLRFAVGRFGVRCRPATLFDELADTFSLGGLTIPALPAHLRWVHACFHEAIGGFRGLRAAGDVARLLLTTNADWHRGVELAESWRAGAVVATAVTDTWDLLGLDNAAHPAAGWARAYQVGRADRRGLHAMRDSSSYRTQAFSGLGGLPGVRAKARYLFSLARPYDRQRALNADR